MNNPGLRLRAMEPEDLDLLYMIENDRQLWNVGNTNVPYSRYVLHDYIASSSSDIYTDRQVRLVVENGVGETVGLADLVNFDARNLRAEVSIVIIDRYRHCGYGQETLRQLTDYASQILHLHQLYALVDAANTDARHLFLKCGYQESVCLSDWLYDGRNYNDALVLQKIL